MSRKASCYFAVLGLAAQSTRFRTSMDAKLLLMAESVSRATELEGSSARDRSTAAESEEMAAADRDEAAELQESASDLRAKSAKDEARAAADSAAGTALADKGAEEEAEAGARLAAAAEDEAVRDADVAEAAAEAAAAAEYEAEVLEDGAAIAVCQFVPFLDALCDVVGAAAEVGLETAATAEAAESAAEIAAAALAEADEESELAGAAEAQAQATLHEEEAADLEKKAAEEEDIAKMEQAESEREEAEAEALYDKAVDEEAEAAADEGRADVESGEATSSWEDSMSHGLGAFIDGLLSSFFSLVVLFFFILRFFFRPFVPDTFDYISNILRGEVSITSLHSPRLTSHVFLHVTVFVAALGKTTFEWEALATQSRQSRGGSILLFAFLAGSMHSVAHWFERHSSHFVHVLRTGRCRCSIEVRGVLGASYCFVWSLFSMFVFYSSLFAIEVLVLLTTLGTHAIASIPAPSVHPLLLIAVFSCYTALHVWLFHAKCSKLERSGRRYPAKSSLSSAEDSQFAPQAGEMETSHLLSRRLNCAPSAFEDSMLVSELRVYESSDVTLEKRSVIMVGETETCSCLDTSRINKEAMHRFMRLQVPFELLVLSFVISLLRLCLPRFHQLLPIFSKTFASSAMKWWFPAVAVSIFVLSAVFLRFALK